MNKTKLLYVAAIAGLCFEAVSLYLYFPEGGIGGSAEWSTQSTHVSASASPLAIVWSVFNVLLYVALAVHTPLVRTNGIPAWWRRLLASLIDFFFFLFTVAPFLALIDLELEARRTGQFVWHFERDYAVQTDFTVGLPMIFISFALLLLYFVFPLTKGKQTVGCFLMRTKVTPPFGIEGSLTWRGAGLRIWFAVRGIGFFWRWLRPRRDADGNTSYDIESNTRVMSVQYDGSQ